MVKIRLYRGKTIISRTIQWQTRSRYNHAAIQIGNMIYEAKEFKGVLCRNANKKDYKADSFDLVNVMSDTQEKILTAFLRNQVNKRYDYTMVFRFVSRRQETRKSKNKWFCSELVFAALKKAGVTLFRETEPWEVSPGLIPRSMSLKRSN